MKALSLQGLSKTYKGGTTALSDVSLDVEEGAFFGLLGPNGAGKSTMIGIISSLVTMSSGSVEIFGFDLNRHEWEAKTRLGLVPQEFNFNGFETVEQIVLNQAGYYGIRRREARVRAEKYLRQLGLWEKRGDASRTLSGGMKRRLMIARALIHEPPLLILDEPTAGVDIELRRSMWAFLREINARGTTIILTTHYLEEAESLCRKIAIIDEGRIIEHTSTQALLNRLKTHAFILDVRGPLQEATRLPGYAVQQLDDARLEVEVHEDQSLTDLFAALGERGISVMSMRNKSNRLEELFLRLLEDNGGSSDAGEPGQPEASAAENA
ncbi:ABC transporter ATP-binding protein [Aquisalimonas asiatica]|uniref:ABC-2 type transport system ATP-binding protein n=1 Tax=Aquisalimonas asiatica TaxID=406100 RepID=A0A1H8PNK9_9GAMM|nr:ABC transporter ATP-binding protein [Aquisalimonas asiatica]SEO43361.1 ABC-2 type transport system ATP-binding protein [Aquisalimonas asiatica]